MRRSRIATNLVAGLLFVTACNEQGRPANPLPTSRLAPTAATGPAGLETVRISDRDTTTGASVPEKGTLTLRFGHGIEVRRLKAYGSDVRLRGPDGVVLEPRGAWSAIELSEPLTTDTVTLTVEPLGPAAALQEVEAWGAGLASAPRDPQKLAGETRQAKPSQFENVVVVGAEAASVTLSPAGLNEGDACARSSLRAGLSVRQARRAYLAYEANVQRASVLQRSVGGAAPTGGFWLAATDTRRTIVDELDPERLTGDDSVLLCLPDEATGKVTVQNLRLLLVTDDGRDLFDREAHLATAEATDGDSGTSVAVRAAPVEVKLDRPTVLDSAEVSVAATPAALTSYGVHDGRDWTDDGALALEATSTPLPLTGRMAHAARLTFAGRARADVPAAALSELSLSGSGVGPRVAEPRLVLTSPKLRVVNGRWIGERFDGRTFVAGWAESPQGPGVVTVEGADVSIEGAFGLPVSRPAGGTGAWDVVVRARFPGGAQLERTLHLEDDSQNEILNGDKDGASSGPSDLRFGAENQTSYGVVDPSKGGRVVLGSEASIDVPPGAVAGKTAIGITRKGPEVIPQLEPGMINVTAPAHSGYRFLPRGQKFAVPAQITLPYDESLLPEGVAPEEIRTYYFDEARDQWVALPRRQVQRATRRVVSETDHFTFMINAVLVTPEHPGPASFDPNSIKDLKAADPSAGIELIESPTPNNQGAARLTFPVQLPKARGGYQPSLSLSYNSSGGDGWAGMGWAIPASSVSIETKYGVPAYDGFERYLLDGEQLVPMAGTGPCGDGSTGQVFGPRVERTFRRIVRCGADPTSYWFEVTDRTGVLFVYGYHPVARLTSYIPRVSVPARNPPLYDVAEWYLERVVDTSGNLTEFAYELDSPDRNDGIYREDFRQVYLRDIWYSGYADRKGRTLEGGEPGAYHVRFSHEFAGGHPATRPDLITSGRLGFKTLMRRRLGSISVEMTKGTTSGVFREYRLRYELGDFGKSRLTSIDVYGVGGAAAGKRFYSHAFEWENASDHAAQAFSNPVAWTLPSADGRGLGATDSMSGGFHVFGGLGVAPTKNVGSIGFRLGMNFRYGETKAALADVNGDGLPDRVADGNRAWFNQAVPGGQSAYAGFSPKAPPGDPYANRTPSFSDFPGLGTDSGAAIDGAVQIQAAGVLAVNLGANYNLTKSRSFLVDANGDGLVDVVEDGAVYLNRPRCGTNATCVDPGEFRFEKAWEVSDLGDSQSKVDEDPTLTKMAAKTEQALSPEDVVLEWTAPYSGTINLQAALRFANEPIPGGRHDGVRLRLYRGGSSSPLATWVKTPDDRSATPVSLRDIAGNTPNGFPVGPGDTLYFVLSTLTDNEFDVANAPEEVSFAAVITYTTVDHGSGPVVPDKSLTDAVGTRVFQFDSKADMRLAGEPRIAVSTGRAGTLEIRSRIDKVPSADDVRMCIHVVPRDSADGKPPDHCPDQPNAVTPIVFGYAAADSASADRLDTLELNTGDALYFQQETELSIDPATAVWRIDAEMTCPRDASGGCAQVSDQERRSLRFDVVPYLRLHQGVTWQADAYQPYPAPPAPYVVPNHVAPGTTLYFVVHSWGGVRPSVLGARRNGQLLFKQHSFFGWWGGEAQVTRYPVTVNPGDRIFFEAFSDKPTDTGWAVGVYDWDPNPQPGCDPTYETCDWPGPGGVPVNPVVDQPERAWKNGGAPVLPGGFHGWRYGLWQGKDGQPIQLRYFRTPERAELESWNSDEDPQKLLEGKKGGFTDSNGDNRKRVELVGVLLPRAKGTRAAADDGGLRPDVIGFVSPDRTAFITANGTMNASRRSLQSTGTAGSVPGAGKGAFSIANLSRSSVGVGISAGASLIGLGVSLGAGLNQQKTDVLDMNGDRLVDTLAAGGVPDLSDISLDDLSGFIADPIKAMWSTDARITDAHDLGLSRTVNFPGLPRLNMDISGQVGLNVSDTVKYLAEQAGYDVVASALPGAGIGFSLSTSLNDLQDVNGDGLPDMLRRDFGGGCSGFLVRLNLGTSFARNEDCVGTPAWGALGPKDGIADAIGGGTGGFVGDFLGKVAGKQALRKQSTVTVSATLAGMIVAGETYGAAASMDSSLNATNIELVDVTGDGLPDYVARDNGGGPFYVMVNRGYGFAAPVAYGVGADWPGAYTEMKAARLRTSTGAGQWVLDAFLPQAKYGIDPISATGTHTVLPSVGATFTLSIPLLLFAPPYLYIGGGGGDATPQRTGGFELGFQDLDGDGFLDHVLKTDENGLVLVRRNQLSGGNLLRKVKRPLGGSFEMQYVRTGNTVDMPESRWVLSQVTVHDGSTDGSAAEPGHMLVSAYEYQGGRYDRYERDFLGFSSVTQTRPDLSTVTQTFLTADFRVKGILVSERTDDKDRRPYTETVYSLGAEIAKAGSPDCVARTPYFLPGDSYCTSWVEPIAQVEKRFYEGQPTPGIVTRETFEYDAYGNVHVFHDWGDVTDPSDDTVTTISYDTSSRQGLYFMDRPTHLVVKDMAGTTLRERTGAYDPANGSLLTLVTEVGDGSTATASLTWKKDGPALGMLESVTSPPNARGDRARVTYDYAGSVTGAYPTTVRDAEGYESTSSFDERWGEATRTTDVNHQVTERRFDDFGRLTLVAGPKDSVAAPTIAMEYSPSAAVAFAVTTNRLPGTPGVRTVVLMDGLERVIQTKTSAEVSPQRNETTVMGWSVTGHQRYDAMGRVAVQGQTFFQPGTSPSFTRGTPRNPKNTLYDVLGRVLSEVAPDGATTRYAYGFGSVVASPLLRFKTTTTDALGKVNSAYSDSSQRVIAVEEHVSGRTPTTLYGYDPLGQLLTVTDAAGNVTTMQYDWLGRRTRLTLPDAGQVIQAYDAAGHVTTRMDAKGQRTSYDYVYDRLVGVHYPDPRRDVTFTYGSPANWTEADGRSAGRIRTVSDAAGTETRAYDELGSLASTTRDLRPMRPGDRWRTFTTSFVYDSFGRMLSMQYPDGELLEYRYDAGGLVKSATGRRAATQWEPAQEETYLRALTYDEFGQRVYMKMGNGVVSTYRYDPVTRRLSALATSTPYGRTLQALTYQHDLVGNVTGLVNALGAPVGDQSGAVSFSYGYDDLHRLTYAHGEAASRKRTIDRFTSTFDYDDIQRMTANVQVHEIVHGDGTGAETPPKTNHAWVYDYGGAGPHQATRIGETYLTYDASGNTTSECRAQHDDPACLTSADHLRRYVWTEENRLDAVIDGGGRSVTSFVYDADGERIVKLGRGGESVTLGQFWALKGRRAATKHVFIGPTRLASKLLPPPGWDESVPADLTPVAVAPNAANENGCEPSHYVPQKCPFLPGGDPVLNHHFDGERVRPATYYYNPDHLGSTSWVTDQNARVHEHVEYFPYGEVWREPESDRDGAGVHGQRFLFSGKELDEETGLYSFGARYLDPDRAHWLSADPALVTNTAPGDSDSTSSERSDWLHVPVNLSAYHAMRWSPLRYVDPDGRDWIEYTGKVATWYEGKFGDRSKPLATYPATSGYADSLQGLNFQDTRYQRTAGVGPVPQGDYSINLRPEPTRVAKANSRTGELMPSPSGGIERIPLSFVRDDGMTVTYGAARTQGGWGNIRARLDPASGTRTYGRTSFYLHDSNKGFTHGCVETNTDMFLRLLQYRRDHPNEKEFKVRITYTSSSTRGATGP